MTETVEHRMTDDVVGLLRHAIATASNDDFSKAGSSDRARHTERIDVMAKAADEIDRLTAALASEREARAEAYKPRDAATTVISAQDPRIIIAGIRQFGLASDGADLQDLEAAIDALRSRVKELEEEQKPVAWRVKDFADGWILFNDELSARREAGIGSGQLIEPLYARSVLKETKDG